MFECPNCATRLRPGARFCGKCGAQIPGGASAPSARPAAPASSAPTVALARPAAPAADPTSPCPHCGIQVPAAARFCGGCGKEIVRPAETPAPAAPQARRGRKTARKTRRIWLVALPVLVICCLAGAIPGGVWGYNTYILKTATPSSSVEEISIENTGETKEPRSTLPLEDSKTTPAVTEQPALSPTSHTVITTSIPLTPTVTATFTPRAPTPTPEISPTLESKPPGTAEFLEPATSLSENFSTANPELWIYPDDPQFVPFDSETNLALHLEGQALTLRQPVRLVPGSVISFTVAYNDPAGDGSLTFSLAGPSAPQEEGQVALDLMLRSNTYQFALPPGEPLIGLVERAPVYSCRLEFRPGGEVVLVVNGQVQDTAPGLDLDQDYRLSFAADVNLDYLQITSPIQQ